jgi:hypothetical protein
MMMIERREIMHAPRRYVIWTDQWGFSKRGIRKAKEKKGRAKKGVGASALKHMQRMMLDTILLLPLHPRVDGEAQKEKRTENAGMGHVPNPTMGKKPNAEEKPGRRIRG